MSMPIDLSIIIPTYHRPQLLRRAVNSALAACPDGGEVIVVDDRSDSAVSALTDHFDEPRLKVVTNNGDKGASGARNFGVQIAQGSVIIFLDDDDEMIEDYPARVLAAAQSEADFGFAAVEIIDQTRPMIAQTQLQTWAALRHGIIPPQVPLQHKMPGIGYGFWIRRAVYREIGGLNIAQDVDEDGDLFCRLYGGGHACWFNSTPAFRIYRGYAVDIGNAEQLSTGTAAEIEAECRIRTYRLNQGYFPLRSADRWYLLRRILRHAAYKDIDSVAKELLAEVTPIDWRLRAWIFWRLKKVAARRRRTSREQAGP